jgi:trk system potassium uptake protein TrkA
MNIVIAGAGKVGFNVAKTLCIGHNITIVDKNSEALHRIQESLDILPIRGDLEDPRTYQNFICKKVDLFIAVTNADNVNLVSTFIADSILDIDRKFVRLQKHFFAKTLIKDRLNIDKIIFPIKLASNTVASLLNYPKANNVKFFKYTQHKLISIRASKDIEPLTINSDKFSIVGIERGKDFFIPQKDEKILPNDLVYFFGHENDIRFICNKLELKENFEIQRCVVFGGEELGISISKALINTGKDVKLIEKNLELCKRADEELEGKASIINSKYGTSDLFENEGLDNADIFIAATNNDEYNIIKCLEAKDRGIYKVVAINNEMEYYNLMHSLDIIVVRGPKISAYNTIMEHITSTKVILEKSFCGAKGIVFMRKIFPTSKLIGKKIKPTKIGQSVIFYIREEKLYPLNEKIVLQENDLLVLFCRAGESSKAKQWIYEL